MLQVGVLLYTFVCAKYTEALTRNTEAYFKFVICVTCILL